MRDERAEWAIGVIEQITGEEDDYTEFQQAIQALYDVVDGTADEDEDWFRYYFVFVSGLYTRFMLFGDPQDLDHVIEWAQVPSAEMAPDDELALATMVADMLAMRYGIRHDLSDLDDAISLRREILQRITDDDARRAGLVVLGQSLRTRYERQRRPGDLDEAIVLVEQAMAAMPPGHPIRQAGSYELSVVLLKRFMGNQNRDDIDRAIAVAREGTAAADDNPVLLSGLAEALAARFHLLKAPADLDEAINTMRRSVSLLPDGHPDWSVFRNSLANFLRIRGERGKSTSDLDEAVEIGRAAVARLPAGNPAEAQFRYNLGVSLRSRAGAGDLDEAIDLTRQAAMADGHPGRAMFLHGLCLALLRRFEQTQEAGDLSEAAEAGATALDLWPADPAPLVALLADVLFRRYQTILDPGDLDQSITLARSISATPVATAPFLFELANWLWARFEARDDTADRDEAIVFGRRSALSDDPEVVLFGATVVTMLRSRHAVTGQASDLEDAVEVARHIVSTVPDDPDALSCLTGVLLARFTSKGKQADLDEGIVVGERLLAVLPADHPDRAGFPAAFANMLRMRYEHQRDPADLAAAKDWETRADVTRDPWDDVVGPARHEGWASKRGLQGHALLEQAMRGNDPLALDRAIVVIRESVGLYPAAGPAKLEAMGNLASALSIRFTRIGDKADLDEAIEVGRAALDLGSAEAAAVAALAFALFTRFVRFGELSDLDESIALNRSAMPLDDGPVIPSNLSIALRLRYEAKSDPADLAEAVSTGRAAVAAAQDEDRPIPLSNLSATLLMRFNREGDPADLQDAVDIGRQAVAVFPAGHPARAAALANLAAALRARSEWQVRPDDLNEAIELGKAAVAAGPPGHAELPMYVSNLGNALVQRYFRTGELTDLDEGIAAIRAAVEACPADHPTRPRYLANLGAHLQHRFADLQEQTDLTEAVAAIREAVVMSAPTHPERPKYLTSLGTALLRDPSTVDEAVSVSRAALASVGVHDPDRPMFLGNLAAALAARGDLDEALALARTAVEGTPAGHSDRAVYLVRLAGLLLTTDLDEAIAVARAAVDAALVKTNALTLLGNGLRQRFERTGDPADLGGALDALRAAADDSAAPAAERLTAGVTLGALAAAHHRWAEATDAYATAIALMPLVAFRGSERTTREELIARWTGLGAAGAACAVEAGQPDRAIELLEHGRGVLWAQLLETRTDISALRSVAPALATRLNAVRGELNAAELPVDRRMSLAVQWDALVRAARALPGFESFLKPPRASQLRAAGGPVVLLNASPWRCDALVVTASDVRVVELPDVTEGEVVDRANAYLRALVAAEAGDVFADGEISDVLAWLWDAVAEPVLATITHERVWWCPTGPFSMLPLHAAGHHEQRAGRTVLDKVVSSYTPSLRSLIESRAAGGPRLADNRVLIVAMPQTPGQPDLPNVGTERDLLTSLFPGPRHTLREGTAATVESVSEQLGKHAWAHFSCHGHQQLDAPSDGGLLLHDGMLAIKQLTTQQQGEFAFLAACKTAVGGIDLPDEAITLTAALRFAGWRHVIGTLWSVPDNTAAAITADVYDALAVHSELRPANAAHALHAAVIRQRDASPECPSAWAPFIHAGS
jgi:tetratricopeptide (TPR) repeat protein/CHAT domain-containing protein